MAAVNRPAHAFTGSNPVSPIEQPARLDAPAYERTPARQGQTILGAKRRLGVPIGPCTEAGLSIGDRLRVRADGPGRIVMERIDPPGG